MSDRYHIAMLWVEGPLSYVEQLCIQSFLDNGHDVTLYHYGEVTNVPDGVDMRHGSEILDRDEFIAHGRTGSMALFSDVFRYHMLTKLDKTIWADTDAYCMRPFTSKTGHFFGWESEHHINGGVLGLPKDSEALAGLLEMTKDEYGIPFWYGDRVRGNLQARIDAGTPTHVSELNWGVWGPHAVTAYLHKTGEDKYAFPCEVLYPVPYAHRRLMVNGRRRRAIDKYITENTLSVHLYGRRIRAFLASREGGLPDEGGYVHELCQKHKIDPRAAPIPVKEADTVDAD